MISLGSKANTKRTVFNVVDSIFFFFSVDRKLSNSQFKIILAGTFFPKGNTTKSVMYLN